MRSLARTRRLSAVVAVLLVVVAGCASPAPTPSPVDSPVVLVVSPSPTPSESPSPSPTDSPDPTDSPSPSPSDSPSPTPFTGPYVATRVVVPALGIDLAIVKSPPPGVYPYCNVAMYFGPPMVQPGQNGATYLFAHARTGMFGPIYILTMVKRTPNKMVGMEVDVYTNDSTEHIYRIVKVLPHQLTLNAPAAVRTDQVWLQTSEGPHGTPGKTQVVAEPVSVIPADFGAAHPGVHPVRCGY